MSPVYGALALVTAYFAGTGVLLSWVDLTLFTDVGLTCDASHLALGPCQAKALRVAFDSAVAAVLSLLFALSLQTGKTRERNDKPALGQTSFELPVLALFAAITLVLVFHFFHHQRAPIDGVRIPQNEAWSISIENLTWPLLLQLAFWTDNWRSKIVFLAFLTAIVALSPFRNIVFVLLYFGALVPMATMLIRQRMSRQARLLLLGVAVMATIVGGTIMFIQTMGRYTSAALSSEPQAIPIAEVARAITSRSIVPLVQAVMAEQLSSLSDLPNAKDGLLRKLRLSNAENLNEFLYKRIYAGGDIGEATSLLYGEAAANSGLCGAYWTFSALILLVLVGRFAEDYIDIGVLIGVAIWRGSMGGLFDVLPALILQVAFCAALMAWKVYGSREHCSALRTAPP